MKMTLHESVDYIVEYNRYSDDPLVVICFDNFMPDQGFHLQPFGQRFLAEQQINNVIVNAARNDWYQNPAIPDIATTIRQATEGMNRIGYGSSMGGFAVLDLFEQLSLAKAIALCPQYSIDPVQVPFENRWRDEAARISFRSGSIQIPGSIRDAVILSDPFHKLDASHIKLIRERHAAQFFSIPFCGHDPAEYLRRARMLQELILDLVFGRFEAKAWNRRIRAQRRNNNCYWLNRSRVLWMRGNHVEALEAARSALELAGQQSRAERMHLDNLERLTAITRS
jgi:hypothetical protein